MNESKRPLISFILTCYNLPVEMIKECVESILALSLMRGEREIIIVDDGSAESPLPAIEEYADNITYIRQRNRGLSVARNTGLGVATGRYIQFVDADDRLISDAYGRCLDIVRYKGYDVVMFNFTSDDKPVSNPYTEPKCVSGTSYMLRNNLRAVAWGYAFRREVLGEQRFTPGIFHEDEEFTPLLLLRAESVCDTGITAYYYRRRGQSITGSRNKRNILKRLNDVEGIIIRLYEVAYNLVDDSRAALKRRVAQLTMDYIYNTMTLTRSTRQLEERLARLERKGLFPLPDRDYTLKYKLFRIMSKNKTLRKIGTKILSQKLC